MNVDSERILEWCGSPAVGSLVTHKGPRGDMVCLASESIKINDMRPDDRAAVIRLFDSFNAYHIEMILGKHGPDRIKVTRQL